MNGSDRTTFSGLFISRYYNDACTFSSRNIFFKWKRTFFPVWPKSNSIIHFIDQTDSIYTKQVCYYDRRNFIKYSRCAPLSQLCPKCLVNISPKWKQSALPVALDCPGINLYLRRNSQWRTSLPYSLNLGHCDVHGLKPSKLFKRSLFSHTREYSKIYSRPSGRLAK